MPARSLSNKFYILKNGWPRRVDMMTWARWFEEDTNRIIARTRVGRASVSTIFLGLDHNYSGKGPPLIFETMVFDGPAGIPMKRYTTLAQAQAGHAEVVKAVEEARQSPRAKTR